MKQPQPPIVMTITFDPATGGINVVAPLTDTVLCYGLLEGAKDVVRVFSEKALTSTGPQPPAHGLHDWLKR